MRSWSTSLKISSCCSVILAFKTLAGRLCIRVLHTKGGMIYYGRNAKSTLYNGWISLRAAVEALTGPSLLRRRIRRQQTRHAYGSNHQSRMGQSTLPLLHGREG